MDRVGTANKLQELRKLMSDAGVDVYVIPSQDAHSSEYTAQTDARVEYVTGFTGSYGIAMIAAESAALSTDNRYYAQAAEQLDSNWVVLRDDLHDGTTWDRWMAEQARNGKVFGIDPAVIAYTLSKQLSAEIEANGGRLIAISENLVDQVWAAGKPPRPHNPVRVLAQEFAGKSFEVKLKQLRADLVKKQVRAIVISALDEIAWLFNLRGNDIPYNPVFFAYAVITPKTATLYIDKTKLNDEAIQYLDGVSIQPYSAIFADLHSLAAPEGSESHMRKLIVSDRASWALASALGVDNILETQSPISIAKAVKNETEIRGMYQCHIRDGAALSEYFAWLEEEVVVRKNDVTEFDAADMLESMRQKHDKFVGLSFKTISSAGPNAAIMHYKPDRHKCSLIGIDSVYLCDSGAQYYDGTTDATRTLHFGTPIAAEIEAYTLVLKGHIAISQAVFPKGTFGGTVDILARQHLWRNGMDYPHATGHGVGSFLNVHEGPIGIGKGKKNSIIPLAPGHVLSNEPGYYENGKFGVRIENVMVVTEARTKHQSGNTPYYGFKHATMVPMCRNLIDVSLLTCQEKKWLNDYHAEVLDAIKGFFANDARTMAWLARECATY